MAGSSSLDTSLPMGTVTFVFTDIEGSTGIAQRFGSDYPALLAEHFDILRGLLVELGGVEVKTTGDGLFAVFSSATTTARWSELAQKAISAHDWPEGGAIRVRIGMHTGEAALEDGDYTGLDVNIAARVMDAGHGGQILLSSSTRGLVGSAWPLLPLGPHLLRGLEEEIDLYQLSVDGMAQMFPPLRTAGGVTNNLPSRLTSLVGRDEDVDRVATLVRDNRLVTLLGPGGVGKTSLGVTVASRLVGEFSNGVVWVDLSAVSDAALVPASIARQLSVEEDSVEGIANRLGARSTLLLLDNFEQVIGASGAISMLIGSTAHARFLITSQAPLRAPGEQRYILEPLRVAGPTQPPGVALFMERARAADPGFEADEEEVRALVAHLDGLPLAIELVAARANVMTPAEMLERLDEGRMPGAIGEVEERHRSLENALAWSYGLLGDDEQTAFRRLGVFAGGMTLSAAEQIVVPLSEDPLDSITHLIDRSLIVKEVGSSRLKMLDGIRRYAISQLDGTGEAGEVFGKYVDLFCAMAADAYAGLQSDRGEWWRSRLDQELDNVRDVLSRLHSDGDANRGLEMVGNVWRFFHSRGHLLELELWLDRFFELPGADADTVGIVKGLMARGALRYWQNRPAEALDHYRAAAVRAELTGDRAIIADAIFGLATSQIIGGQSEDVGDLLQRAKDLYAALGDSGGVADVVTAEGFGTLMRSGVVGLGPMFERAERLYLEAGRSISSVQAMLAQAAVALAEGRPTDARQHVERAIDRGEELGDRFLVVWGVEYAALIVIESDDLQTAALLVGASEREAAQIGGGWGPASTGLDDGRVVLERRLGKDEAQQLISLGRAMGIDEAIALFRS